MNKPFTLSLANLAGATYCEFRNERGGYVPSTYEILRDDSQAPAQETIHGGVNNPHEEGAVDPHQPEGEGEGEDNTTPQTNLDDLLFGEEEEEEEGEEVDLDDLMMP